MKKTRLLLIFCLAVMARAQEPADTHPALNAPAGTDPTTVSFPFERIQTPDGCRLGLRRLRQQTTRAQCQFRGWRFVHPNRNQEQQRRNCVSGGKRLSGGAEVYDRA